MLQMKNSTVKEIRGQHGLEFLSIQVSIMYYWRMCILQNHNTVCKKLAYINCRYIPDYNKMILGDYLSYIV